MPRREASEEHSAEQRGGKREEQDGDIEVWVRFVGDPQLVPGHQAHHAPEHGYRKQRPQSAAHHRQRKALDQELPENSRTGCPLRGPDSDFFLPRRSPRKQQIRNIDASNQEHEPDRSHHEPEAQAGALGKKIILQRLDTHHEILILATDLVWLKGQRDIHLGITIVRRTGIRNSQDGIQFAAHAELSADNAGIAPEPLAPVFVVEDDYMIVAGLRVFRNEMPPENHFCSKQEVEKAGRYAACLDLLRPFRCRDGKALSRPGIERLEDLALFLPVEVVDGRSAIALPFLVRPDHNDSVAIHIRERRKQHRIEQAENRRRGPNAQGQGKQGHRREPRTLPEQPQAVANIAPKFGHNRTSPCCLYSQSAANVPSFRAITELESGWRAVAPELCNALPFTVLFLKRRGFRRWRY